MKKTIFLPIFAIATFSFLTGFMISNLDATSNKHFSSWGKSFYTYAYPSASSITATSDAVQQDDGESVFKIDYTIATDGGVGLGVDAPGSGNAALVGCTKFTYKYKGSNAHDFKVAVTGIEDGKEHFKQFSASSTEWKTADIPIADLKQPEWVSSSSKVTFQLNKIESFKWQVKTEGEGSLSIKDFEGVGCAGIAASSSSAGSGNSSSSFVYSGESTLIDDFEDGKSLSKLGDYWYIYTDKNNGGRSTVANEPEGASGYKVLVNEDGEKFVKIINYVLDKGTNTNQPFVAIGVKNKRDLSGCTGGFRYDYKGVKHNFNVKLSKVTDDAHYFKEVASSSDWKTISVAQSDLKQPTEWGTPKPHFDASLITEFAWEVKGGVSATTGDLSVDNFTCLGTFSIPSSSSVGTTTSSSSTGAAASSSSTGAATSSSSTGASQSSSSTASSSSAKSSSSSTGGASQAFTYCVYATLQICTEGPFTSCQDGGLLSNSCPPGYNNTPIIKLPSLAHSKALSPVHNGVNLQSTDNASIQVFDLKGNAIRTLRFEPGNYVVQLTDLPKGLYVVKATSSSWKQTIKVAVR